MSISRRNFLKVAGGTAGVLALAGCNGGGTDAPPLTTVARATPARLAASSSPVGIINNDPNESGYRTANDKDMKETFTEENGFAAEFAYSMKNEEQIQSAQQFIQNGVKYLLVLRRRHRRLGHPLQDAQAAGTQTHLSSTASSTPTRASTWPPSSPTWTPRRDRRQLADRAGPRRVQHHPIQGVMGPPPRSAAPARSTRPLRPTTTGPS